MGVSEAFKWVTVASFDLDHEASVCMAYLESEGLKVRLKNEFIARAYPSVSAATGGIQVMVPDKDVIRASVLLQKAGYLKENSPHPFNEWLVANLPLIAAGLVVFFTLLLLLIYYFS